MQEPVHKTLVEEILATIALANISRSDFGRMATNDPCLVTDLEKGRELRSRTRSKVVSAIAKLKHREDVPASGAAT